MGRGGEVVETVGEVEESKESEEIHVIADVKDPEHRSRCPYCGEWVSRLHGGSIYLYVKRDRLFALVNMDHVFKDCRHGLMENIKFLYRMMVDLKARGV